MFCSFICGAYLNCGWALALSSYLLCGMSALIGASEEGELMIHQLPSWAGTYGMHDDTHNYLQEVDFSTCNVSL